MTQQATVLDTHGLTHEQMLEIAYYLHLTRSLEERLVALFRQSKVIGGIYRSLGSGRRVGRGGVRSRLRRPLPLTQSPGDVHEQARTQNRLSRHCIRCEGSVESGDPRRRSGALHRAQVPLPQDQGETAAEDYVVPIGKANVRRRGKDLTIITWGAMVYVADDAANELQKDGVSAEIIDMRSIIPFDEEAILESVGKTNRVMILHEAPLTGGAGAEFAARIAEKAFEYLDAPIKRVAALDVPTPYSPPLEAAALPDKAKVLAAAREMLAY